jgi:hypothetical protein
MVPVWDKKLQDYFQSGDETDRAVSPRHAGSRDYVTRMENIHPGYLHELWRYAVKTKGSAAKFQELAETMNLKSAAPGEAQTELNVSGRQLSNWFHKNSGKQRSSKEKPLLMSEMKQRQRAWIAAWGDS